MKQHFWKGKKVLITGHTGFKGSWLSLLLSYLGSEVIGYSLKPPSSPSLYEVTRLDQLINSIDGDVRNYDYLKEEENYENSKFHIFDYKETFIFERFGHCINAKNSFKIRKNYWNFGKIVNKFSALHLISQIIPIRFFLNFFH